MGKSPSDQRHLSGARKNMPEEIKNLAPLTSPQISVTQIPLRRKNFVNYSEKIIC